jgi:Holliday junction resolvase-like predicted endonuclease
MSEKQAKYNAISPQERKLLDIIKELDYGEIDKIIVKRGEPVFVRVATKDIKLD